MARLSKSLLFLALIKFATASFLCTTKNAYPLPPNAGSGGGASPNVATLDDTERLRSLDAGISLIESASHRKRTPSSALTEYDAFSRPSLKERQSFSLSCPDTSTCFLWDSMDLLCADLESGELMASNGECGNFITKTFYECKRGGDKSRTRGGEEEPGSASGGGITAPATRPVANAGSRAGMTFEVLVLAVLVKITNLQL